MRWLRISRFVGSGLMVITRFNMISARFGMRITGFRVVIIRFRLVITGFRVVITGFRLVITGLGLVITGFRVMITGFRVVITRFVMRSRSRGVMMSFSGFGALNRGAMIASSQIFVKRSSVGTVEGVLFTIGVTKVINGTIGFGIGVVTIGIGNFSTIKVGV